jgi:hypothetical protein
MAQQFGVPEIVPSMDEIGRLLALFSWNSVWVAGSWTLMACGAFISMRAVFDIINIPLHSE